VLRSFFLKLLFALKRATIRVVCFESSDVHRLLVKQNSDFGICHIVHDVGGSWDIYSNLKACNDNFL